jgi:hypothetical protein
MTAVPKHGACALALALVLAALRQDVPETPALGGPFAEHGILLDVGRGVCSIPVRVEVRDDLLEYLLVGPAGASHESVFQTDVVPSVLNTALLLLGVDPGKARNAAWVAKDPAPTEEEMRAGAHPFDVTLPEGDRFYLYVAWRSGEERFLYRMEDLVRNLRTGRSMRRHAWVYLGSRMVRVDDSGKEVFAADVESNLINVSFFPQGNTLVTAAVEDSVFQTIWLPNAWLLPERGTEVRIVFARERVVELPDEHFPEVPR